jgi:hypothetical protein
MKRIKLSIPFAFFLLIGSNAFAFNGLSESASDIIGGIISSVKTTYHISNFKVGDIKVRGKCPEHYPLGSPIVISIQKDKIKR